MNSSKSINKEGMNRCIGINKKGKKCRYKIKDKDKYFCCEEHKPINKEILESGCFMCCEKVEIKDLWILKCNHAFHYECLNDWFSNNSEDIESDKKLECPICRKEYVQNQLKKKKEIDFDKIYGYTTPILELLPD